MSLYNLSINIEDKKCVVVGGGKVALRKVRKLCQSKAKVFVISLEFLQDFHDDSNLKNVTLIQSDYNIKYIENSILVFAATSNISVNEQICNDAKSLNIWVNSVNGVQHSSFIIPAVFKKDILNIGIITEGKAPLLSKRLRQYFQNKLSKITDSSIQEIVTLRENYINTTDNKKKIILDLEIKKKTDSIIKQIENC